MTPPRGHIGTLGWWAPLSFNILFKNCIIGVICNKCIIHSYSYFIWHEKDDYHEFKLTHEVQIKK